MQIQKVQNAVTAGLSKDVARSAVSVECREKLLCTIWMQHLTIQADWPVLRQKIRVGVPIGSKDSGRERGGKGLAQKQRGQKHRSVGAEPRQPTTWQNLE